MNKVEDYSENTKLVVGYILSREIEFSEMAKKYDDALKRIHDLESELEYLRREVNRT